MQNLKDSHRAGLQAHALRLTPGEDVLLALMAIQVRLDLHAAFLVAGIGSATSSMLRYAGEQQAIELNGPLGIISLSGTRAPDAANLHIIVSDYTGRVLGGHLKPGSLVRTTAEILLANMPGLSFLPRHDVSSGFQNSKCCHARGCKKPAAKLSRRPSVQHLPRRAGCARRRRG